MNTLFLAWQAPEKRCWVPIGRLTYDGVSYQFIYTQGVREAQQKCNFQPLESFPQLDRVYESNDLFPLFSNRVLSRSRPDYQDYIQWLNIPKDEDDPIALLARSGGRRATDKLEIFPCPEPSEYGEYHIHFFPHGLRHFPEVAQSRIERLHPDEKLSLMYDFQNPVDPKALMLRTEDNICVGYCPSYLLSDVFAVLHECAGLPIVKVERVNPPPAPLQYRLLCNMTACWPDNFQPFAGKSYQPIVKDIPA